MSQTCITRILLSVFCIASLSGIDLAFTLQGTELNQFPCCSVLSPTVIVNKLFLFWPALNCVLFSSTAPVIKQSFPVSGLWLPSIWRTVACSLWLNYWSCCPSVLFGIFFAATGRKSNYYRGRFSKAEERENAPNVSAFKGSWTPNCT